MKIVRTKPLIPLKFPLHYSILAYINATHPGIHMHCQNSRFNNKPKNRVSKAENNFVTTDIKYNKFYSNTFNIKSKKNPESCQIVNDPKQKITSQPNQAFNKILLKKNRNKVSKKNPKLDRFFVSPLNYCFKLERLTKSFVDYEIELKKRNTSNDYIARSNPFNNNQTKAQTKNAKINRNAGKRNISKTVNLLGVAKKPLLTEASSNSSSLSLFSMLSHREKRSWQRDSFKFSDLSLDEKKYFDSINSEIDEKKSLTNKSLIQNDKKSIDKDISLEIKSKNKSKSEKFTKKMRELEHVYRNLDDCSNCSNGFGHANPNNKENLMHTDVNLLSKASSNIISSYKISSIPTKKESLIDVQPKLKIMNKFVPIRSELSCMEQRKKILEEIRNYRKKSNASYHELVLEKSENKNQQQRSSYFNQRLQLLESMFGLNKSKKHIISSEKINVSRTRLKNTNNSRTNSFIKEANETENDVIKDSNTIDNDDNLIKVRNEKKSVLTDRVRRTSKVLEHLSTIGSIRSGRDNYYNVSEHKISPASPNVGYLEINQKDEASENVTDHTYSISKVKDKLSKSENDIKLAEKRHSKDLNLDKSGDIKNDQTRKSRNVEETHYYYYKNNDVDTLIRKSFRYEPVEVEPVLNNQIYPN